MDGKKYGKAIENASDSLIDVMLEDVDELVEEGLGPERIWPGADLARSGFVLFAE